MKRLEIFYKLTKSDTINMAPFLFLEAVHITPTMHYLWKRSWHMGTASFKEGLVWYLEFVACGTQQSFQKVCFVIEQIDIMSND